MSGNVIGTQIELILKAVDAYTQLTEEQRVDLGERISRILLPQFEEYFDDFESSVLSCYAFDPASLVLQVDFNSGSRYQYFGVSADTFAQLKAAPSKGQFFSQRIRNQHLSRKLSF